MDNLHLNSRAIFYSRALIVERVFKERKSVKDVAEALGVSRRTVYKWLARYRSGGHYALYDRSFRPQRSPRRLPVEQVATIAVMRCLGLNRLPRLGPRLPVIRYEHNSPGDMIHLDINTLRRIDWEGHRIHGDRSRRSRGAGWEHLRVCVDEHSRLAYTELLPDERATTATCFLLRAADWLKHHGVAVRRAITDNGSCSGPIFSTPQESVRCAPGLTLPGPTARPSDSSRPALRNGPTGEPTNHQPNWRDISDPGSTNTTTGGPTPR